jgi:hypothetical protein
VAALREIGDEGELGWAGWRPKSKKKTGLAEATRPDGYLSRTAVGKNGLLQRFWAGKEMRAKNKLKRESLGSSLGFEILIQWIWMQNLN